MTSFDLRHGDCLEGMAQIADGTIDLVVTSPPYNLGIAYSRYSDRQDREGYLDWCHEWAAQVRRILKPAGSFFSISAPHLRIRCCRMNSFCGCAICSSCKIRSIGSRRSRSKTRRANLFLADTSSRSVRRGISTTATNTFFISRRTEKLRSIVSRSACRMPTRAISRAGATRAGSDRRCRGNTWFIPYQTISRREKDRPHPATFPVELAANCIRLHGLRDDLVMLDPFLGIGNSALAARECGVAKFIGFEIDEKYLAEAQRRPDVGGESTAGAFRQTTRL